LVVKLPPEIAIVDCNVLSSIELPLNDTLPDVIVIDDDDNCMVDDPSMIKLPPPIDALDDNDNDTDALPVACMLPATICTLLVAKSVTV
jgi:hypothetical protein